MLLAEYNGRLAAELEDRRQLARMLTEYISSQREALSEREKKLEARIHTHIQLTLIALPYVGKIFKVVYEKKKLGHVFIYFLGFFFPVQFIFHLAVKIVCSPVEIDKYLHNYI